MTDVAFELRRVGEEWETYELSVYRSAFLNFLQSTVLCQLAYLRMNASERGLQLTRVRGLCQCDTSDFMIDRLLMSFAIELEAGSPTEDDLAYLRERCLACPVSKNLPHVTTKDSIVLVGSELHWPSGEPWESERL